MANGRGGIRGLAFPTFGGQKSLGVTPIQIPQVRTAFPSARGPVRRAPEPTTTEKVAGILPLLLQGGVNFFRGRQPQMTVPEYIESIGADPENLTKEDEAQIAAFTAFGPQQDVGGFKGQDLLTAVIASQMGRGAPEFVRSAINVRSAENERKRLINQQRGEVIEEFLKPPKYNYVNILDKNADEYGINSNLSGRENEDTGELELLKTKEDGSFEYVKAGPNFIKQTGTQNVSVKGNPRLTAMKEDFKEIFEKEHSAVQLAGLANNTIDRLEALGPGDIVPGTMVASLAGLADRGIQEVNSLRSLGTIGIGGRLFATAEDVENGLGGTKSLKYDGSGTGLLAEELYNAIQSGDEDKINAATDKFDKLFTQQTNGVSLRDYLGEQVFNNVRLRSQFLQLAYTAAAVNGQTGRTLSDKDLAYHLQIVGLGQTTNPQVLIANLKSFVQDSINSVDDAIKLKIQQNLPRYDMNDPAIQTYINSFYRPLNENVYSNIITDYEFLNFAKRRPDLGLDRYFDVEVIRPNINNTIDADSVIDNVRNEFL